MYLTLWAAVSPLFSPRTFCLLPRLLSTSPSTHDHAKSSQEGKCTCRPHHTCSLPHGPSFPRFLQMNCPHQDHALQLCPGFYSLCPLKSLSLRIIIFPPYQNIPISIKIRCDFSHLKQTLGAHVPTQPQLYFSSVCSCTSQESCPWPLPMVFPFPFSLEYTY